MITAAIIGVYFIAWVEVWRRCTWYMIKHRDRGMTSESDAIFFAAILAVLLPIGVGYLILRSKGADGIGKPPKSVRQAEKLKRLEKENARLEAELGIK